jgi:hypothetical protein
MTIFSGQTRLIIEIDINAALTDVVEAFIQYENPSGIKGEWAATITNPTTGIIQVAIGTEAQTNPAGLWKLWPKLVYADDKIIYGTASSISLFAPGTA